MPDPLTGMWSKDKPQLVDLAVEVLGWQRCLAQKETKPQILQYLKEHKDKIEKDVKDEEITINDHNNMTKQEVENLHNVLLQDVWRNAMSMMSRLVHFTWVTSNLASDCC